MNEQVSEDSMEQTIAACAWLIDIAQESVDRFGWDPVIVRYLDQLGEATHRARERQLGGMGAVAPMATH